MRYIEKMFQSLGTMISIQIGMEDDSKITIQQGKILLRNMKAKIERLDDLCSVYKKDSEISKLNRMAGKEKVMLSKETFEILEYANTFTNQSNGSFDISLQPLIQLWGIGKKRDFIPEKSDIEAILEKRTSNYLMLDKEEMSAFLKNESQKIDLGSIVKGYAADEVLKVLKANGIKEIVLNFGGTVYVHGKSRKIGIQNPFLKTGETLGHIELKDAAAVTSGFNEQHFKKDGKIYHHILDPKTGYPVDNNLASITLIGKNAVELDALTTAIYVMGIERGSKLLEEFQLEGIFVLKTKEVFHSKGLTDLFTLNQNNEAEQNKSKEQNNLQKQDTTIEKNKKKHMEVLV